MTFRIASPSLFHAAFAAGAAVAASGLNNNNANNNPRIDGWAGV
ncbi:hypothetical protein [Dyella koreensis]